MPEDNFVADIAITIAPNPCVGLAGFAVHALDVAHSFALLGCFVVYGHSIRDVGI